MCEDFGNMGRGGLGKLECLTDLWVRLEVVVSDSVGRGVGCFGCHGLEERRDTLISAAVACATITRIRFAMSSNGTRSEDLNFVQLGAQILTLGCELFIRYRLGGRR